MVARIATVQVNEHRVVCTTLEVRCIPTCAALACTRCHQDHTGSTRVRATLHAPGGPRALLPALWPGQWLLLMGAALQRTPLAVQGGAGSVLLWEQGAPGSMLVPLSALPALLTTSHMHMPLVAPARVAAGAVRCCFVGILWVLRALQDRRREQGGARRVCV